MRLISFSLDHFKCLHAWFKTERDLIQWGGPLLSFPLTIDQCEAMIAEGRSTPPGRFCWMVEHNGVLVGHVQLVFDQRNGNARLSRVVLAPHTRGRGLAQPMLRLAIEKAFAQKSIERLELNVYSWNVAAIHSYRKVGFVEEGVRRLAVRVGSERWDTTIMSLLRPEWIRPFSE